MESSLCLTYLEENNNNMSKNYISGMLDTILAAKMKMQDKFQSMGRAWAADTAQKQKLIDQGKYRLD